MLRNIQNPASKMLKVIRRFCTKPIETIEVTQQIPETRNVDMKDIAHLGSMSQAWWDLDGELKALHSLNQLRVPLIRDGLMSTGLIDSNLEGKSNVLEGLNLLEVGCGGGILTEALVRLNANVVGIDPNEKLLQVAKDRAGTSDRVDYRLETIEEHVSGNQNKYDAVIASEVLEHIKDQRSFLKSCVEAVKPGGSIFITTLNKTQASWLLGIVAAEYVLKALPRGTHEWNQFISPVDVDKILKEFNCHTVLVHGMFYEIWRNNWIWCRNTDMNYALHAVKADYETS
jgi:polyprenyldihydroxybenzoate methyltransferase/3-demethylubiquinol 3-O-methyltransferase